MVQFTLSEVAAPGNTEVIPNISVVGAQTLSANTPGPNNAAWQADITAAITGIGTSAFVSITYTDANAKTQIRAIKTQDIKQII
jgi:hypothetical protein